MTSTEPITKPAQDLASLIRGKSVTVTGRLASMSHDDFVEIIEAHGGRYTLKLRPGVSLLVIGEENWPLTRDGTLAEPLREARVLRRKENVRTRIVSEEQFLVGLGLERHREHVRRFHTTGMLCELLEVSRERVQAWVKAGLIYPAYEQSGVRYFDFRQVSAAKTLCELARSGVTTGRLRKSLEQLKTWLPDVEQPLRQLALLEQDGRLVLRLEEGDLAEFDGQLQLDFGGPKPEPAPLRIDRSPRTAGDWAEQGAEQERAGASEEAVQSYREALLVGGVDAGICFSLANVLSSAGHREQALERYRQAIELNLQFTDAWNNLGVLLSDMGSRDEACAAFRKALATDSQDARTLYNLADTLDEMGRWREALPFWEAYLRMDGTSRWAAHAESRLVAGGA